MCREFIGLELFVIVGTISLVRFGDIGAMCRGLASSFSAVKRYTPSEVLLSLILRTKGPESYQSQVKSQRKVIQGWQDGPNCPDVGTILFTQPEFHTLRFQNSMACKIAGCV